RKPGLASQRQRADEVHECPQVPAIEPHQPWKASKHCATLRCDVARQSREHPRGRTLEDGDLSNLAGDAGKHLRGARSGADDRNAASLQRDAVIPFCRVKTRACECLDPFKIRPVRQMKAAERADDGVAAPRLAAFGMYGPVPFVADEVGDLAAEANL